MTPRAIIKALVAGSITTFATATLSVHAGLPAPLHSSVRTCPTSSRATAAKLTPAIPAHPGPAATTARHP